MIKYELDGLAAMVHIVLRPSKLMDNENASEIMEQTSNQLEQMFHLSRVTLGRQLLQKECRSLAESVPLYQAEIVSALDTLNGYLVSPKLAAAQPANRDLKKFYEKASGKLKNLLRHIHQKFYAYCNPGQVIPRTLRSYILRLIKSYLKSARSLNSLVPVDERLQFIAWMPLSDFVNSERRITYRKLEWIEHYFGQLKIFLVQPDLSDEKITAFCIGAGLNCKAFYDALIDNIKQQTALLPDTGEQINLLRYHLKNMRQLDIPNRPLYDPDRTGMEVLICNWLEEEIGFLDRQTGRDLQPGGTTNVVAGKLRLSLSVYELALGVRLLTEAGIVSNESFREISRYMSANVQTKNQEQLSVESFRKKYYGNFEKSVINNIHDKIIVLMNLVKSYR